MTRRAFFAALCLCLAALFTALGVWQVQRRAWKLDLIARVEARLHAAPQPLPPRQAWAGINERDHGYTRVRATGTFLHDRETLVQALTERGAGWWVMTPLQTADAVLLVNRGFVPDARVPRSSPAGAVVVTGLLRMSALGGGFLRANDPAAGRWYSRDIAAIARARSLGPIAPFFIDADATPSPDGYPIGGLTVTGFRNSHAVYALTWFALAALALGGAVIVLRDRRG